IAGQDVGKPALVECQLRTFLLGVPQMNYAGSKYAILPVHAGVEKPCDDIGIFLSPPAVVRIEAIDTVEIRPPDGKIAGPRALPCILTDSPKRTEWQG